jgi:hypothetical protein
MTAGWQTVGVSDLTDEPRRSELDTSDEPEPDWANAIRRARRERGERLRRLLADAPDAAAPAEPRDDEP